MLQCRTCYTKKWQQSPTWSCLWWIVCFWLVELLWWWWISL